MKTKTAEVAMDVEGTETCVLPDKVNNVDALNQGILLVRLHSHSRDNDATTWPDNGSHGLRVEPIDIPIA